MQDLIITPAAATAVIAFFALIVAILTYRIQLANRRASLPSASVDWKLPLGVSVTYDEGKLRDRFVFFEAVITNHGGRAVSLIEMAPKEECFVHYLRLNRGEKVSTEPYDRPYRCFACSRPAMSYLSLDAVKSVLEETELELEPRGLLQRHLPLDVVVEPGKTVRYTVCFFFPMFEQATKRGYNRVVGFTLRFNNR